LACQDEFLVKNLLNIKENYDHALDFEINLSRFFGLGEFGFMLMLSFPNTCLIIARVSVALLQRFVQRFILSKSHQAQISDSK
jgi:hypothetical protein